MIKFFKANTLCLFVSASLLLSACSQQARDREIKADITVKAKEDVNFAGVSFTVDKAVVSLWGRCPTEKSKAVLLQKLSTVHVIKALKDRIVIGPVSMGLDFSTKLQVDSVLATYPGVVAELSANELRLIGKIESAELPKVLKALDKISNRTVSVAELNTDM